MLKFFLTFVMRVISRFIWMGVGFAIVMVLGRGPMARSVKMSLKMMRRATRF